MPSNTATVVPFGGVSQKATLGKRGDDNLRACFPASPLKESDYNPAKVRDIGNASLLGAGGDGEKIAALGVKDGVLNDGGYFFPEGFDLRFGNTPDINSVETGGEGLPATPFVPNPTSPGPGSVNPSDQAPFQGTIEPNTQYGVGLGGTNNPAVTSPRVSGQKIGEFISGRSYAGSDGRA